jgi:hypothetical protein
MNNHKDQDIEEKGCLLNQKIIQKKEKIFGVNLDESSDQTFGEASVICIGVLLSGLGLLLNSSISYLQSSFSSVKKQSHKKIN